MPDAGAEWEHGLNNFGQAIARGILIHQKREDEMKQKLNVFDGAMQAYSQLTDSKGKPLIDEKTLTTLSHLSGAQRLGLEQREIARVQIMQSAAMNANKLQEAQRKADIEDARIPQIKAQTKAAEGRGKLTDIQIGQQLGIIPKIQQPPTGGQLLQAQQKQRKELADQRDAIEARILQASPKGPSGKVITPLDPESLLDDKSITYQTKGFMGHMSTAEDPKAATHVQIEGGPQLPIGKFNRLRQHAEEWQKLDQKLKTPAPQIVQPPPHDSQMLINNPTTQNKAYFDQVYGQGAADLVINAVQPQKKSKPAPEPDDTEDDSDSDDAE